MATFDTKIVGGTVVDGTGKPGFSANVAIKDGRIVEVGDCKGDATTTIDADGAIWSRPASRTSIRTTTGRCRGTTRSRPRATTE